MLIDFIIGLTLVNALPHFMAGLSNTRFLSLFGFSAWGNIGYAALNTTVSVSLFLYQYGTAGFMEHAWILGGLFVVVAYYILGKFLYSLFHTNYHTKKTETADASA